MSLFSKNKKGPFNSRPSIEKALIGLAAIIAMAAIIWGFRSVRNLIRPNGRDNIGNNQVKAVRMAGKWFDDNSAVKPDSVAFVSLDLINDYGRYTDSTVIEHGFRIAMLEDVGNIAGEDVKQREWSLAEIENAETALRKAGDDKNADILGEESKWIRLMFVDSVLFYNEFNKAYTEEKERLENAIKGVGYNLRLKITTDTESGRPNQYVYIFLIDEEFKSIKLLDIIDVGSEEPRPVINDDILSGLN